jgi:TolB-like protein
MSDANKAVFLSYASQDAEAARRVCEALRSGGVEVWFDADGGLEHGDEWDAKIRRQIKECVLFIPLISANTQARHEGYFRLEWELAAERAMSIASGVPFILPVVIDDTREPDALVPDRFRKVQWTRVPGGEVPPDVHARFLKLWSHRVGLVSHHEKRTESATGNSLLPPAPTSAPARRKLYALIAAVVAFAAVAWWVLRDSSTNPAPVVAAKKTAAEIKPVQPSGLITPAANEKSAPADKSLVVLPLENLSPDPENTFFTDGMHSEIIATLSRIPELKVISRPTALALKGSAISLAETAKKVGVANVVSGSVRRAGERVRIQLELRRAADEALLWSQTYDRELKDVFAIQSDIADEVARALQARESKGAFGGARFSTKNPKALDLFLRARGLFEIGSQSGQGMHDAAKLLKEALVLDPEFVSAASLLANIFADLARGTSDPAEKVAYAAEAKRYAELASRLAPGGAGDAPLGFYYAVIEGDGARALSFAENAVRALPNDAIHQNQLGIALGGVGRTAEALAAYRKARELDPLEPVFFKNELNALVILRRSDEFEATIAGYKGADAGLTIQMAHYQLKGELPASLDGMLGGRRATWAWISRHFAEAESVYAETLASAPANDPTGRFNLLCTHSDVLVKLGRTDEALKEAREALALAEKLQTLPELGLSHKPGYLAVALVRVGRTDEAIAAGQRNVELASSSTQKRARWSRELDLARIYALAHRPRESVALLAKLLLVPSRITVPMLRLDPEWDNLRDDPGFQALFADPKNSAPL